MMDLHWESHFVQIMELRYAPMMMYQVENLRMQNWESLLMRYVPLLGYQVEMDIISCRVLHWVKIVIWFIM